MWEGISWCGRASAGVGGHQLVWEGISWCGRASAGVGGHQLVWEGISWCGRASAGVGGHQLVWEGISWCGRASAGVGGHQLVWEGISWCGRASAGVGGHQLVWEGISWCGRASALIFSLLGLCFTVWFHRDSPWGTIFFLRALFMLKNQSQVVIFLIFLNLYFLFFFVSLFRLLQNIPHSQCSTLYSFSQAQLDQRQI